MKLHQISVDNFLYIWLLLLTTVWKLPCLWSMNVNSITFSTYRGGTLICQKELPLQPLSFAPGACFRSVLREQAPSCVPAFKISLFAAARLLLLLWLLFRGVQLQITLAAKQGKISAEHYSRFLRRKSCLFNYDKIFIDRWPPWICNVICKKKQTKHSIQRRKIVYVQRYSQVDWSLGLFKTLFGK